MLRKGNYAIVNPGHEYSDLTVRVVRRVGQEGKLLVRTTDDVSGQHTLIVTEEQVTKVGGDR